jgi:hypothetical protein
MSDKTFFEPNFYVSSSSWEHYKLNNKYRTIFEELEDEFKKGYGFIEHYDQTMDFEDTRLCFDIKNNLSLKPFGTVMKLVIDYERLEKILKEYFNYE